MGKLFEKLTRVEDLGLDYTFGWLALLTKCKVNVDQIQEP